MVFKEKLVCYIFRNDKIALQHKWSQLDKRLGKLEVHPLLMSESSTQQCVSLHSAKFMFEEGALVTAMRKGQWIVLDEINLAPSDVLQRLKGLLTNFKAPEEDPLPFILTENSGEEIIPHENFRIFACMNPSLEINEDRFSECLKEDSKETSSLIPTMKSSTGKKDLPSDIRGCFSEFYVDEVTDVNDLTAIIQEIIPLCERNLAENVATFYLHARSLCSTYQIATGLGTTPHFSLRTLTRALKFAVSVMKQRWKPQNAKVMFQM
jgi:midasin